MKTVPAREVIEKCLTPEQKQEVKDRLPEMRARKGVKSSPQEAFKRSMNKFKATLERLGQ